MNIKYNLEKVRNILFNMDYILVSDVYIPKKKLVFKDKDGYYYTSTLDNLISKKNPNKFSQNNPYVIQNIKIWCKLNNKLFEILSENYINAGQKLKWKCLKENCGEVFESDWRNISSGRGCPFCAGKKIGLSNCLATKNPKLAKEWHPIKNGNLTPWDVACNAGKDVWWLCSKNPKHEWKAKIYSRNNSLKGCPYCSGRYPSEENNLLICNPELIKEWDFNKNKKRPEEYCPNSNKYVWWKCQKCGYEWKSIIANRNRGRDCPNCNEPKGEKRIKEILNKLSISYISQYSFSDLLGLGGKELKFDFSIFDKLDKTKIIMLIEYDGEFHFKKCFVNDRSEITQEHDRFKNEYCKQNNIPLLRIPYWDFSRIEEILRNTLCKNERKVEYDQ